MSATVSDVIGTPESLGLTVEHLGSDPLEAAWLLLGSILAGKIATTPKEAIDAISHANDDPTRDNGWLINLAFTQAEHWLQDQIAKTEDALGIPRPLTAARYYAMEPEDQAKVSPDEVTAMHERERAASQARLASGAF